MSLNTQQRFWLRLSIVGLVILALCVIFPRALAFAEMAAREIRYLWWLILLLVFGGWLIWLSNKKIP
jgi:hypothetical protein